MAKVSRRQWDRMSPKQKQNLLHQCELDEWEMALERRAERAGRKVVYKPIPKGYGATALFERCVLHVKCQQKVIPGTRKVNPWAICHSSVG